MDVTFDVVYTVAGLVPGNLAIILPYASQSGSATPVTGYLSAVSTDPPTGVSPTVFPVTASGTFAAGTYTATVVYTSASTSVSFVGSFTVNSDGSVTGGTVGGGGGDGCTYTILLGAMVQPCVQAVSLEWVEVTTGDCPPIPPLYEVSRKIGGGSWAGIASTTMSFYLDDDSSLPFGTAISYYVSDGHTGATSNVQTVTLGCAQPLSWGGSCEGDQVTLTWAAVAGASGYVLRRNGSEIYTGTATRYVDTGVTAGMAYDYTLAVEFGESTAAAGPVLLVTPCALYVPPTDGGGCTGWTGSGCAGTAWGSS